MVHDPALYSLDAAFWRRHAWWPLIIYLLALAVIGWLALDERLARFWFFDSAASHWLGSGDGEWWAHQVLHTGGRWVVRAVAASALLLWSMSFMFPRLRALRSSNGFIALAMISSVALVGTLKSVTNVDCPWDLAGFGGAHPAVAWFADRPDWLPRARCFPGAHSASGFALCCFYFLWRDSRPRWAHAALLVASLVGLAFALGQEARGAHFLSHDLAGAGLVWFTQLGIYAGLRGSAPPRRGIPTDDV